MDIIITRSCVLSRGLIQALELDRCIFLGAPLPNTFDDLEEIKRTSKPVWKCADLKSTNEEATVPSEK